jgi:hypothetical protein
MLETARETPSGPFVEVGVYKGGSAWHLAQLAQEQGRELHLFDTFSGIPYAEPGDNHNVGDFADTSADVVAAAIPYAVLHVGLFEDRLPVDLTGIAFAHIDCDQYRSALAVIGMLGPRMLPGGVMWFDDYNCTWGVTKAVNDAFGADSVQTARTKRGYVRF